MRKYKSPNLALPVVGQVRQWKDGSRHIFLVIEEFYNASWSDKVQQPLYAIRYSDERQATYSDMTLAEDSDVICDV